MFFEDFLIFLIIPFPLVPEFVHLFIDLVRKILCKRIFNIRQSRFCPSIRKHLQKMQLSWI